MNYIVDIIILVIIAIFTVRGVRNGFFYSAANFLSVVVAIIIATLFSDMVSEFLFNTFFRAGLEERLMLELEQDGLNLAVQNLFETLPKFMIDALAERGITQVSIVDGVSGTTEEMAIAVTASVSEAIITIINFFVIIILAIILIIAIKFAIKLANNVFKLPLISQVNQILGGVFGFMFSLVLIFVVISAATFLLNVANDTWMITINEYLENSLLAEKIMNGNPFTWIFE